MPSLECVEVALPFTFEFEREIDGRWIAEIPEVPGALAYGDSQEEAAAKAQAVALRAIADEVEETGHVKAFSVAAL